MPPKILVGCPTSDHKAYCLDAYARAIKTLTYKNYDILIVDNSSTDAYAEKIKSLGLPVKKISYCESARERIVKSRNIIRETVLREGYDYFFSLEQDVIPPPDVIEQLLAHKKDIVSGVYFKDFTFRDQQGKVIKKEILPLVYQSINKEMAKQLTFKDVQKPRLIAVAACGVGCILIHRSILETISFRYVPEKEPFDDLWFCHDAREKGHTVYVDTSIKCKHLIKDMSDWKKIKK